MSWHRPGDKPLSEAVMINLLTHICVTRPQWVNLLTQGSLNKMIHRWLGDSPHKGRVINSPWNLNQNTQTFIEKKCVWKCHLQNVSHFPLVLTHWGRVMHICVSNLITTGSVNGLLPGRHQDITLTNAGIFYNWTLRNKIQWNFNRNSNIFIEENAFENIFCEMTAILSRPQCVNTGECHYNMVQYGIILHTSSKWLKQNFNPLWPSEAIWWHKFVSTLARAKAYCVMALSHYLDQCWLNISMVQWD